MFMRLRFHLASGSTVTRYVEADEGAKLGKEDIKEFASVFKDGMTDSRIVDDKGGAFVPSMSGVLLVEIDVVLTKAP